MNIKIIIATHKPYWMPEDDIYLPLHVGKEGKENIGFQGDNTGENISRKNPNYSELTGLYWAWKNLDADYIGLVHYRRHFSVMVKKDKQSSILTGKQLERLLTNADIILPKKRKYYIETIYDHYGHLAAFDHLDKTRDIIKENYPDYLDAFDRVMRSRNAHMFNMLIMKKEILDKYCQWFFSVLSELESRIDTSSMTPFEARCISRVGEMLLDVWIIKNHISYREIAHIYMEPINWPKKIWGFLSAKFFKKKYSKSW